MLVIFLELAVKWRYEVTTPVMNQASIVDYSLEKRIKLGF